MHAYAMLLGEDVGIKVAKAWDCRVFDHDVL
jgi:hypothetical protein